MTSFKALPHPPARHKVTVALAFILLLLPVRSDAEDSLQHIRSLIQNAKVHQKADRHYQAMRLYFQATEKLAYVKTDKPTLQQSAKELGDNIQTGIGEIKASVQKDKLIPYRGKFYTFEGLQKVLRREADRKKRYEKFLRWERQERLQRQEQIRLRGERRRFEEQRLHRDYVMQQEQRRQNEDRRREYEMRRQRETQ